MRTERLRELAGRLRGGDWSLRSPQELADMVAHWIDGEIAALGAEGGDKPVARVYVTEDDYDIEWLRPYSTGFLYDRPAAAATGDMVLVPRKEQDALLAVVRESCYGSDLGRECRAKVALQNYNEAMKSAQQERGNG